MKNVVVIITKIILKTKNIPCFIKRSISINNFVYIIITTLIKIILFVEISLSLLLVPPITFVALSLVYFAYVGFDVWFII